MTDSANTGKSVQMINGNNSSDSMLKRVFQLLEKEYFAGGAAALREKRVVDFRYPDELKKTLPLSIPEKGLDEDQLLHLCKEVMKYSVRTDHPFFFNQLFGAPEKVSLSAAIMTECMNTSVYTFEVAPVFILMEDEVFRYMRKLAGWSKGDGLFCPGGSISNMYGLSLARFSKYPESKTKGMRGLPDLRIYTSDHSHYSMKKGVFFMGFGMDSLVAVSCDDKGRMLPDALEACIQKDIKEGKVPFFVNGTSGTTVYGAFDPLKEIAKVCKKHDLWFHVDGCLGSSALVSDQLKHLMEGIEDADSFAWNPHKVMGIPLQCAVFLTQHNNLREAHSAKASYLFQQDKFYDMSYDTGDKSIQCGRKTDIFKLWLCWQGHGASGFAKYVEHKFALAQELGRLVENRPGFQLVVEPSCINVCFWYIPPSLRNQERDKAWWLRLAKVAPEIKKRMTEEGAMLIGYQPLQDKVNFFRMVTTQVEDSFEDMTKVLDIIDRLGNDIDV